MYLASKIIKSIIFAGLFSALITTTFIKNPLIDILITVLIVSMFIVWIIIEHRKEPEEDKYLNSRTKEQLIEIIKCYKEILKIDNVPKILIEHPELIRGKEPNQYDIEWAEGVIKEYESSK